MLINPTDSNGNICGYQEYANQPNLYYFDLTECASVETVYNLQCSTRQICVESCPDQYSSGYNMILLEQTTNQVVIRSQPEAEFPATVYCQEGVTNQVIETEYRSTGKLLDLFQNEICAAYTLPSNSILNRCVPSLIYNPSILNDTISFVSQVDDQIVEVLDHYGNPITYQKIVDSLTGLSSYLNLQPYLSQSLTDFENSWWIILLLLVFAAVLSQIWIILLRFIVKPMIYITFFLLMGVVGYAIYGSIKIYNQLGEYAENENSTSSENPQSFTDIGFTTDLSSYLRLQDTWFAFIILTISLEVIMALIFIVLWKRFNLACEIMKEASKALASMWSTLFFPIITWISLIILICWFLYATICLDEIMII